MDTSLNVSALSVTGTTTLTLSSATNANVVVAAAGTGVLNIARAVQIAGSAFVDTSKNITAGTISATTIGGTAITASTSVTTPTITTSAGDLTLTSATNANVVVAAAGTGVFNVARVLQI